MMNRSLALLTLLALATPAQALKLIVWDPELQTVLGYGESSGGRITVQLLQDYAGPVKVLFSREEEEDEKARGLYSGVQSGYNGTLKAGQLTLKAQGNDVTLTKFLSTVKLSVQLQPAVQILELPGLRTAPEKNKTTKPPGGP